MIDKLYVEYEQHSKWQVMKSKSNESFDVITSLAIVNAIVFDMRIGLLAYKSVFTCHNIEKSNLSSLYELSLYAILYYISYQNNNNCTSYSFINNWNETDNIITVGKKVHTMVS